MDWFSALALIWVMLASVFVLALKLAGVLLGAKSRRLSRLNAEVCGLLQREQHVRRLRGEIDAAVSARSGQVLFERTIGWRP